MLVNATESHRLKEEVWVCEGGIYINKNTSPLIERTEENITWASKCSTSVTFRTQGHVGSVTGDHMDEQRSQKASQTSAISLQHPRTSSQVGR